MATADNNDVAANTVKRKLGPEWLNKLARKGEERRRREGLRSDENVERVVEHAVAESRLEERGQ